MTLPIAPVTVGSTGVVADPTEQIVQDLLRGLQVGADLKDKKIKRANEAHERQVNEQLGMALKQYLLSQEPQTTVPAGTGMPWAPGTTAPITTPTPSPFTTALQGVPPEAVLPFAAATAPIRAQQRTAAELAKEREILAGSDLTTDVGKRRAVRQLLQGGRVETAEQVARTLNIGQGRYGYIIAPDGNGYITDSKEGGARLDRAIGKKPDPETTKSAQRNAGQLVELLDEQTDLIRRLGIGSSKNPTAAAIAEASKLWGVSFEGLSNALRNDPEQLTRMLRTRFAHLYIGLLPHSRSSEALLQNLAESYWAPAGSDAALLRKAERDRQTLRRILTDLRDGKTTDWSRLPGFGAAANAAAADATTPPPGSSGPQGTTNMDDWVNGVPPQ